MSTKICSQCAAINDEKDSFCINCGKIIAPQVSEMDEKSEEISEKTVDPSPYHYMTSDFSTSATKIIEASTNIRLQKPEPAEISKEAKDRPTAAEAHHNRHCGLGYAIALRIVAIIMISIASTLLGLWFYSLPFIYAFIQYLAIPIAVIAFLILYLLAFSGIKLYENIIYIRIYTEHVDRMIYLQDKNRI